MIGRRSLFRALGIAAAASAIGARSTLAALPPMAAPAASGEMMDGWPAGQFCIGAPDGRPIFHVVEVNGEYRIAIRGDAILEGSIVADPDFDTECAEGE